MSTKIVLHIYCASIQVRDFNMANITLKLDDALLREARILAARRGTSVSRLVAEQLEAIVRSDRQYDSARKRALKRMRSAQTLAWTPPAKRDELHER